MASRPNPNKDWEQLKHAAAQARLPFDKDVWLNLAFYLDEQYVEWKDDIASVRVVPRPDGFQHAPRPVVNKIMHFVNQEHAHVLQAKPNPDVLPATDDLVDISDAQVALSYLRWLSDTHVGNFDRTLSEAVLWAQIGGEGYVKWVFNPRLKRPDFVACSPLDIYPDPYATDFTKCRYIIHSQFMDVEQVYDMYGIEVKPEDTQRVDPMKAQLLREMGAAPVLSGAVVNELWLKPNRRHPNGKFVVWTGKQTIADENFPYGHKHLPFTQIGQVPRPGSLHYSSAVKYLRSAQMELNKYHAQRIMIREAFANPKWWIDSMLELEALPDDSPRQVLRGNSQGGTLKPEVIQPTTFPGNDDGAWISEEMMHIVGLHEVSQAQVPGRVEAAKAIELLKESDTSRQAVLLDTIKLAISEGFWQLLMLARQYVGDEAIAQTYTREGLPEVKRFKAGQIKEGLRVRVSMTTGLARSRTARTDQLLMMWDKKIINDPEIMAELMEIPVPTFVSHRMFDIRLARNENIELAKETAIVPNSWDDHEIHIREHNNYRKTQEYAELSKGAKQRFEHHVKHHEQFQMDAIAKMAQTQALMMAAQTQPQTQPQTAPNSPYPAQEPVMDVAA